MHCWRKHIFLLVDWWQFLFFLFFQDPGNACVRAVVVCFDYFDPQSWDRSWSRGFHAKGLIRLEILPIPQTGERLRLGHLWQHNLPIYDEYKTQSANMLRSFHEKGSSRWSRNQHVSFETSSLNCGLRLTLVHIYSHVLGKWLQTHFYLYVGIVLMRLFS